MDQLKELQSETKAHALTKLAELSVFIGNIDDNKPSWGEVANLNKVVYYLNEIKAFLGVL